MSRFLKSWLRIAQIFGGLLSKPGYANGTEKLQTGGDCTCRLKGLTSFSLNPVSLKHSCEITGRFSTTNFQKIRIEGTGEYWTCGQDHDPRNWNWKPWQHLERLCRKQGLDDFAVRDIIFEHLGRKLECECQVLLMRGNCGRRLLEGNSGLILTAGRSGWWIETELQNRFQWKCEMEFGILGSDDGLPGFSGWERKWGYGQEDRWLQLILW